MYNAQQLQKKLPMDVRFDKHFDEVEVLHDSFIDDDGILCISAENGTYAIDYYGEFRDGYPYIAESLQKFAQDNNGHFEWKNPGCIAFYQ